MRKTSILFLFLLLFLTACHEKGSKINLPEHTNLIQIKQTKVNKNIQNISLNTQKNKASYFEVSEEKKKKLSGYFILFIAYMIFL
jgi:hypothetical protein